jgi:predicted transcriptional regulator
MDNEMSTHQIVFDDEMEKHLDELVESTGKTKEEVLADAMNYFIKSKMTEEEWNEMVTKYGKVTVENITFD